MIKPEEVTLRQIAKSLENELQCNCDLDKWEPDPSTGHSHVCRIHKYAISASTERRQLVANELNNE